jgi:hypothetical protein
MTSVYVNDAADAVASIGILAPPPQKARGLTAEGASHWAFMDESPKNNEMLNSSNFFI